MPYKTGEWGEQERARSKRRASYFREYYRHKGSPKKVFRLGRFGELLAQQKLNGSQLVNKTGYDLLWNKQRIEVKTSMKPVKDVHGRSHHFDISIQQHERDTDFFMFLILNEHTRELEYVYFIPAKAITAQKILNIYPERSQYERFRLELNARNNPIS